MSTASELKKVFNTTGNNQAVANRLRQILRTNKGREEMLLKFHKQVKNEQNLVKKAMNESKKNTWLVSRLLRKIGLRK